MNYLKSSRNPSYVSWRAMKQRCRNPLFDSYKNYGRLGIDYCEEWEDFRNFVNDMGDRPKNCTLDRLDNSKNYCKSNCKWSTLSEQNRNRSTTVMLTKNEKTMCIRDWADFLNIKEITLYKRIQRGWSVDRALN